MFELIADWPELGTPVAGAPGYLQAEIVYSATHEGARALEDVLFRRTHIAIGPVITGSPPPSGRHS